MPSPRASLGFELLDGEQRQSFEIRAGRAAAHRPFVEHGLGRWTGGY